MLRFPDHLTALVALLGVFALPSVVSADSVTGSKLFSRYCQGCHMIGPTAKNQFGPQLNGVFQRAPASVYNYDYSSSFEQTLGARLVWQDTTLDALLKSPMQYIVGTKMAFPGVKKLKERQEIISYLRSVGPDGVLPTTESVERTTQKADSETRILPRDAEIPEHGVLHLGRVASNTEVAAWNIDVRPDGTGLPPGSGSVTDGTELYDTNCAVCHGVFGEGAARWPVLAGGQGTLADERPEKTIGSYWPYLSTVYDYIRRAMPFGNVRSLSDDDVYAITAYLLYLNDLVDEDFELNSENFSSIQLPNEANFIADNRQDEPHYTSNEEPCMENCYEQPAIVAQRARILDVTPDTEDDEAGTGAID